MIWGTDDWIDRNKLKEANESWYSDSTIAGAISAGVTAGIGTALGGFDAATNKFLSGAIKLGTAAAGKTAEYATYAAYSLAEGGTLLDAYDNMGGLTINVANLGAILDLAGSVIARGNNDNQSIFGDGKILQKLSEIGLLEVNFGSEGVSTAIGMGGIDVGGAVYEQLKRGIDYAGLKSYAKEEQNSWKADMAWKTYVYGDFTQENTAMRLASGKDYLDFTDKDFGVDDEGRIKLGETVSGGRDGKGRTITITDIGDLDTMSVVLGHEAYRDGSVGADNKQETRDAVIAHTKMAARMRAEDSDFSGSFVGQDLAVYDYARSVGNMGIMAKYADDFYDSSGDFWLTKLDGSYFDDGNDGVISFEDGRAAINTVNKGKQGSLEEYLGLESGEGYSLLMREAGFVYDNETRTWSGSKTISADAIKNLIAEGIISADVIAESEPQADGGVSTPESKQSFWQSAAATAGGLWNNIKAGVGNLASWASGLFKKPLSVPEAVMEDAQISDYIVSMEQWSKLADPEFYGKYEAQVKTKTDDPLKQLDGLSTQCNTFVDAVIKGFGDKVYNDIMPYGSQSPNALYGTWNNNPNLLKLKNGDDAWAKAQEYADQGYIVLSAASDNKNHVAFVLPKGYEYNSLPSTDWKQREGVNPSSGTIDYSPDKIKKTWPAFLQSGSYTGILSPGWAYSSKMIEDEQVHFYVYKRGGK